MKKNNNKILVTGGSGFLGAQICRVLYDSGYEPIIIDHDKNRNWAISDFTFFNFDGIVDGSSKPQFVKIKFQLLPDSGSTKKSKSKEIYLPINNENYSFNLKIEKVVSTVSNLSNTWEDGYKYIFESITLYDQSTSVEILNNGKTS